MDTEKCKTNDGVGVYLAKKNHFFLCIMFKKIKLLQKAEKKPCDCMKMHEYPS